MADHRRLLTLELGPRGENLIDLRRLHPPHAGVLTLRGAVEESLLDVKQLPRRIAITDREGAPALLYGGLDELDIAPRQEIPRLPGQVPVADAGRLGRRERRNDMPTIKHRPVIGQPARPAQPVEHPRRGVRGGSRPVNPIYQRL